MIDDKVKKIIDEVLMLSEKERKQVAIIVLSSTLTDEALLAILKHINYEG